MVGARVVAKAKVLAGNPNSFASFAQKMPVNSINIHLVKMFPISTINSVTNLWQKAKGRKFEI